MENQTINMFTYMVEAFSADVAFSYSANCSETKKAQLLTRQGSKELRRTLQVPKVIDFPLCLLSYR